MAALLGVACVVVAVAPAAAQTQAPVLTLEDARAQALASDPNVDAAEAGERAAEAEVRRSRRWNNPTLEVLQENAEGTGPYEGTARAETTFSVRQPLELGGDRDARRRVAESTRDMARIGVDLQRLDTLEEVEHAFIDAQAAEAALVVAEERLVVARELAEAVDRRVRAARDPFMAGARAQTRLAEAEIEAERARRAAELARRRLASYWDGADDFRIDLATFGSVAALDIPDTSPDAALGEALTQRAEAQVRLERAARIPDVDLQFGLREFNETDDTALVVGVAVPLQLWNRNGDGIARARAERERAERQRDARARALARERDALLGQAEIARLEVEALDTRVIPSGEDALRFARDGYERGAFSYIDVLEAQRALSDAQLRRIEALRSYHRARASLARLAGVRAEELSP
jgi:cobalt-zinc-cadmium efflux system outer membrane protein